MPLHISVSDGRDFRKRQVTKILIDPTWWDAKTADLKKRVLIPEEEDVLPMVPGGKRLDQMVLGGSK